MWSQVLLTQGLNSKQMPFDLYKKYGLKIQNVDETQVGENIDTTEYFQSSPQSKKLGIKFSATKINNKISVNPLDTVSVSAELVDSQAGKTAVVDSLKTDNKYPGVSLDAIKSLEYAAARNGATSMSVSAKRLNLKLNDKVIQNYADAGFTMSVNNGEAFFVKKLDPVVTYNQATISPIGFYSQVEAEINKMDFTQMPAKDLMNRIKNIQGLKKEELEYLGLEEFLAAKEGKVTKDEVLAFVKENGVQVEQIVLGGRGGASESGFDFSEAVFEKLSDADYDSYRYAVSDEMDNYGPRNNDNYEEDLQEQKDILLRDDEARYKDDEDLLKEDATAELDKIYEKRAEEYVDSEEYFDARFTITEKNSGHTLVGNDERGWYSDELNKQFDGNEEEAKIQFAQALIDADLVEGASVNQLVSASEIKFREANGQTPSNKTIEKKARDLEKKDYARLRQKEIDAYPTTYENKSEKEIDEQLKDNNSIYDQARDEIISSYADVTKSKNKVIVKLRNKYPGGQLVGNNIKGWEYQGDNKIKIESKDLDAAKKELIEKLVKKNIISADKIKSETDDVNKPTGKSKWKKYTEIDSENYREILLTLPKNKGGDFSYTTHFDEDNFVAHARLSDANIDGKKTLFIEEIQSDWHQQGREGGYKDKDSKSNLEKIETQIDDLTDQLRQQEKDYTELKAKVSAEAKEFPDEQVNEKYTELVNGKYGDEFDAKDADVQKTKAEIEKLKDERRDLKDGVSDAPFKQTDAWASLVMKRMIRLAAEQGYEKVAWTPAAVHQKRWGTENVSWIKKDPIKLELTQDPIDKMFYYIPDGQAHGKAFADSPAFYYDPEMDMFKSEDEAKDAAKKMV